MNSENHQQGAKRLGEYQRVGEGRTAEILAWGESRVVRLFRDGASEAYARRELAAFKAVSNAGLPSPAVYPAADTEDGLVRLNGRLGFVMDRIDGPSMLGVLTRRPWKLGTFASALASYHLSMHRQHAVGLPSQRQRFERIVDSLSNDLGEDKSRRIRHCLDALPDGAVVCHGDFHPDNIILGDRGPVIIDWGPATIGAPAADVAWTVYLFRHGGSPPGMSWLQQLLLNLFRRLFLWRYIRSYRRHAGFDWLDVDRWGPVIAAIRLNDGIPEEREPLLEALAKAFGSRGAPHQPMTS